MSDRFQASEWKIVVAAGGFRMAHVCLFSKAVISYSEDEGDTYTVPAIVIDSVLDDRDSGIVPYGEKNVILTPSTMKWRFRGNRQTEKMSAL